MKTININFDVKSIKQAIKEIQAVKKKMQKEVPKLFISKCLVWVENRANNYLNGINMDGEVLSDIQSNWNRKVVGNIGTLTNTSEKAVYVEFGVGRIAQRNPHPQANTENYEYNVQSNSKKPDGSWIFDAQHKQYAIDLQEGYYVMFKAENANRAKVKTKGSPANLYLYNAMMDLISSGAYKTLWQETLTELIK